MARHALQLHDNPGPATQPWELAEKDAGLKPEEVLADRLRRRYGELMTREEVAQTLRRSMASLLLEEKRGAAWAVRLAAGRVRHGRRVFFRPEVVAAVVLQGDDEGRGSHS